MDPHVIDHPPTSIRRTTAWFACGILIASLCWALVLLADGSFYSQPIAARFHVPIGLLIASGAAYLVSIALAPRALGRRGLILVVVVAIAMRIPMWFAPSIPGADYNRYLWDGAVSAAGISPYRYSPREALKGSTGDPAIERLRREGSHVLEAIEPTNAHLRTCYPPIAQGLFALAHWIAPFHPAGWRIVLLGADVLAGIALFGLLRAAGGPLSRGVIYLWNPLLAFETYLRCHLDLAVAALIVVFVWALWRRKTALAAIALVAAIGVKLYPLLLVPLLIRRAWGDRRRLLLTTGLLVCLGGIVLAMFVPALQGTESGTLAYARTWEVHAGAFRLIHRAAKWITDRDSWTGDALGSPQMLARRAVLAALIGVSLWQALRKGRTERDLPWRVASILLAVLLLSPTLWPWYYLPLIPLAVMRPRPALLLWTVLLGLVYLPQEWLSGEWLAWVVHVPVWLGLGSQVAMDHLRRRREMEPHV
jgi:alpha-1,6-mannosyltransferase